MTSRLDERSFALISITERKAPDHEIETKNNRYMKYSRIDNFSPLPASNTHVAGTYEISGRFESTSSCDNRRRYSGFRHGVIMHHPKHVHENFSFKGFPERGDQGKVTSRVAIRTHQIHVEFEPVVAPHCVEVLIRTGAGSDSIRP
jgi:hypothetical protein